MTTSYIAGITRRILRQARELHIKSLCRVIKEAGDRSDAAWGKYEEAAEFSRWANEQKRIVRADAAAADKHSIAVIEGAEAEIRQVSNLF